MRSRSSRTPIFSSAASSFSLAWRPCWTSQRSCVRSIERARRAGRARDAILAAELVDDRAGDPGPRVLLERGALGGIEAVDRLDDGDEAARDEVVELAVRGELARLARGEVLDHRRVGEDEPVARARSRRASFQARQSDSASGPVRRRPSSGPRRHRTFGGRFRDLRGGGRMRGKVPWGRPPRSRGKGRPDLHRPSSSRDPDPQIRVTSRPVSATPFEGRRGEGHASHCVQRGRLPTPGDSSQRGAARPSRCTPLRCGARSSPGSRRQRRACRRSMRAVPCSVRARRAHAQVHGEAPRHGRRDPPRHDAASGLAQPPVDRRRAPRRRPRAASSCAPGSGSSSWSR